LFPKKEKRCDNGAEEALNREPYMKKEGTKENVNLKNGGLGEDWPKGAIERSKESLRETGGGTLKGNSGRNLVGAIRKESNPQPGG